MVFICDQAMEKALASSHQGFTVSVPEPYTSNQHFVSRTRVRHPMQATVKALKKFVRNRALGIQPNPEPPKYPCTQISYVQGFFRRFDPAFGGYYPVRFIPDNAAAPNPYMNVDGDVQIVRIAAQRDVGGLIQCLCKHV